MTNYLAKAGAQIIRTGFDTYQAQFRAITRRAKSRFENRDGHGMRRDAAERLDIYGHFVTEVETRMRGLLGNGLGDKATWAAMKDLYSGWITHREDGELAETFFNSITRRLFTTVGVNPQIEFVKTAYEKQATSGRATLCHVFERPPTPTDLALSILTTYNFAVPYQALGRDAHLVGAAIESHWQAERISFQHVERVEMLKAVFYRGQGAYLVGRVILHSRLEPIPLVLALVNQPQGIVVDTVLQDSSQVSILFSFTRSYFHVEVERPYNLVAFLKSLMPHKPIAELYIALGYNKHGKTEFYRDLLDHLAHSQNQFEIAPGERGLVMVVFTIPDYEVVFKVIKDHFPYPKVTTREAVKAKYHLVFRHDRAGRLVDAQEFEHLKLDRHRISEELFGELLRYAAQSMVVEGDSVSIRHVYIERRVTPLDVYVREVDEARARAAVLDLGRAIKDLAVTNIFPGDMLLKNFGVTRHGRVIFYDYDELCLLSDCHFRAIPQARNDDDEMASEPWFTAGDNDFFPEEFRRFLGLPEPLRLAFLAQHGDLFGVGFWRETQARLAAGELIHIYPYDESQRL